MEIRPLLHDAMSDDDARTLAELQTLASPRRLRTDPPVTSLLARNELRPSVKTWAFRYWGGFDGATMIAFGETAGAINAANDDACEVGIVVHPEHADTAATRALFDHIEAAERGHGRTRFWGWGDLDCERTRAFWEDELGYTLAYDERISRCTFADIPKGLMDTWTTRAQDRASGYHLERVQAPFPERIMPAFAQALEAMEDAPHDDLEVEPEQFDAERAREVETLQLGSGSSYQAVFAFETATGELAGLTATRVPHAEPERSWQGDTVTMNAHRNRGIGRWIKADMIAWLLADRPEVQSLFTGNAESNRAMLAINEEMGFRDVLHHGVWHLKS